jgi:hypothetical protein
MGRTALVGFVQKLYDLKGPHKMMMPAQSNTTNRLDLPEVSATARRF